MHNISFLHSTYIIVCKKWKSSARFAILDLMPKVYFAELSDHRSPPHYKFFDGEKWTESQTGNTIDIISPLDGHILGRIQQVSHHEIDQAIDRAIDAQKNWQKVPMIKRAKILHLAADWIRHHEQYLTNLLIKEIGKSVVEAKDEILRSADMIEYFANEGLHLTGEELSGESFPGYDKSRMAIIERVPRGVILAISPFNYPVNLSVSKIAPALVAGNAVILKPSSQGAISALHLVEIFRIAGIPDGVLAVITGEGSGTGEYLSTHRGIDLVSFTGSSETGKNIAEKIGMTVLLFECGGNNPAIVSTDADLEFTASELVKGAFSYSGQRCTAIKYVLGLSKTIEKIIPLVVKKTKETIKMGDPRNKKFNLGPLISDTAADMVEKRILMAKTHGAKVVCGGKRNGRFVEPTIIEDARPAMEIVNCETFGPVLSFVKVKSMDEAIDIINDSHYGLQASVFTRDEGSGIKFAESLNVGSVQINSCPRRGPDHFPFLGIKGSGIGVQGVRYTLEAMTRPKPIILNKPQ